MYGKYLRKIHSNWANYLRGEQKEFSSYFYSLNILIYAVMKLHRVVIVNDSKRLFMKTFSKNSLE